MKGQTETETLLSLLLGLSTTDSWEVDMCAWISVRSTDFQSVLATPEARHEAGQR